MITIVKVGGAILENSEKVTQFLNNFIEIKEKKILVHGGGRTSSELMKRLGIEPEMIDGRRVTNASALKIVTMAYSAINKQVVAKLQALNCNSIGLCGADENMIRAVKRSPYPIDFGWVGDIKKSDVQIEVLQRYLEREIIPVFAPLTHDGKGNLLNTNADTIASIISQALAEKNQVRLVYAFEKKGLLKDINDNQSIISEMTSRQYDEAKLQNFIHTGMIPKLDNAFAAIQQGVSEVYICNLNEIHKLQVGTRLIL